MLQVLILIFCIKYYIETIQLHKNTHTHTGIKKCNVQYNVSCTIVDVSCNNHDTSLTSLEGKRYSNVKYVFI